MAFILSSQNVLHYLSERQLCPQIEQAENQIELKFAKNFNLLLNLSEEQKLLVKQERHDQAGKTAGEFLHEWRVHQLLQSFPELSTLQPMFSEVLHFDPENSILVFNYLTHYIDLTAFYAKQNQFPTAIAREIGTTLAKTHQSTFNGLEYQNFFAQGSAVESSDRGVDFAQSDRLTPDIFGLVPADGIKFFVLYQRYDSLKQAILELRQSLQSCCLTHNDLKLNNILLHQDWESNFTDRDPLELTSLKLESREQMIRLIDWERGRWGDPAFDLGTLIASYLQIWLNSLVVSQGIAIEESLRLATMPLETLQPSIAALTCAYLETFPGILEHRPYFLKQVVQCSGLALTQQIQAMIQYSKSFGNLGICMLQVAKTLLCRPEQSILTVFGVVESELTDRYQSAA
jgi:thiamine kinase-like enzyme